MSGSSDLRTAACWGCSAEYCSSCGASLPAPASSSQSATIKGRGDHIVETHAYQDMHRRNDFFGGVTVTLATAPTAGIRNSAGPGSGTTRPRARIKSARASAVSLDSPASRNRRTYIASAMPIPPRETGSIATMLLMAEVDPSSRTEKRGGPPRCSHRAGS